MNKILNNRQYVIDLLKLLLSLMVICIHFPFPKEIGQYIVAICRIAVPIFFMITGFYYINIVKANKANKQICKIFKLLLVSNLIYIFWDSAINLFNHKITLTEFYEWFSTQYINTKTIFYFVFFNESPFAGHLWYLSAILYVLLIVKHIDFNKQLSNIFKITPLLLLIDLIFGKYSLALLGKEFNPIFCRNFLLVGIPYFFVGILFHQKQEIIQNYNRKHIIFYVFLGVSITIIERYLLITYNLNSIRDHYIGTTLLAVSIFALTINSYNNIVITKYPANVDIQYATYTYILHPMVGKLTNLAFNNFSMYMYTKPISIFLCTILLLFILKTIHHCAIQAIRKGEIKCR